MRVFQVVHTVYWLSRKSSEFGIPLAYYFDINNPTHHSQRHVTVKQHSSFLLKASQKSSGSCSSSSSSQSSSPYFSSSSSSSLNQYTTNQVTPATSLSILVGSTRAATKQTASSSPLSFTSSNAAATSQVVGRHHTAKFVEETDLPHSSDETATRPSSTSVYTSNKNSLNMSYIYKQQQQQQKSHLGPLKISNSNQSELNLKSEKPLSPSQSQLNCNVLENSENTFDTGPISPVSSSSTAVSPQQQQQNTQHIPTRYVDRRISTSALPADPHKFNVNYSTAGQKLARKAQELLKSVEISKESETPASNDTANIATTPTHNADSLSNGISDDWQNVILVFLCSNKNLTFHCHSESTYLI